MTELNSPARRFCGVVPPLVTPLRDRDTLDEPGLTRLLEHVLGGGVRGVFILGTTGEGPHLSYRLRRELITQTCEIVDGRAPVLVGVTDSAFAESAALAEVAADAGAAAVVLAPPYYVPTSQAELLGYVRRFAAESPLPVMLYNMPSLTKVWYEFETVRELTAIESIVGVKDSGGDLDYFQRLVSLRALRPDWSILIGPEHLLVESMQLGGDGGVAGGANAFPRLFVACYQAYVEGDAARVARLQQRIVDLQGIYAVGDDASRFIKATKCALSVLGICDDLPAEPLERFVGRHRDHIAAVVRKLETAETAAT
ncbi:MAG: dihydrodipicolinate synthase family protein [Pirellulaceae bacterium]